MGGIWTVRPGELRNAEATVITEQVKDDRLFSKASGLGNVYKGAGDAGLTDLRPAPLFKGI